MTQQKFNELMKTYGIVSSELEDIFAFVTDLLYCRAKELEHDEPYASRSIDILYSASREVDDLIDYISELEEE